jgi:hypothetical protein
MNGKEKHKKLDQNVLLSLAKNVPPEEDTHVDIKRKRVTRKGLTLLAESNGIRGITILDIMENFGLNKKKDAQRKVKYMRELKLLFTAGDLISEGVELPSTFRNRSPQKYFAASLRATILERIKKEYRNELLKTTGVTKSNYPLFPALESQRASSFLEVLQLISKSSIHIHKINIMLSIGKNHYQERVELLSYIKRSLDPKKWKIGKRHCNFIYHPNGNVQVFVECSRYPMKMETDEDVNLFFSFMGQIKSTLVNHLGDLSESIIPPVNTWILKQCDINSDVTIADSAQLCIPDVQLKTAGRVFRMYVKPMNNEAVCRVEESKEVNRPLSRFNEIFMPDVKIEQKIDNLTKKLQEVFDRQKEKIVVINPYPNYII